MNVDIKLHKDDLPDDLSFGDKIAIDCEFMGLNVERDRLCLFKSQMETMMPILFNLTKTSITPQT